METQNNVIELWRRVEGGSDGQGDAPRDSTRDAKGRFVNGHPKMPGCGRPRGTRAWIRAVMQYPDTRHAFEKEVARRMARAAQGKTRDAAWILAVLGRGP